METSSVDSNDIPSDEIIAAIETSDLETLNTALKVLDKEEKSVSVAKFTLLKLFFQVRTDPKNVDERTLKAAVFVLVNFN